MNVDKALGGLAILVTRPEHQAQKLCELIESNGGRAVRFPTLEIRGLNLSGGVFANLENLKQFDWLLFISANAVYFALKACDNELLIPAHLKVAAIGQATAAALERNGIAVDLAPREGFNSEALLAMPRIQSVRGQRFLIVRGQGGREILAETLRQRGAHVRYTEVYQRLRPTVELDSHLQLWRELGVDAVTIFSGESLINFVAMLGERGMALVRNIPLFVVGERIAAQAEQAGFYKVNLVNNANDWALFEALARISGPERGKTVEPGDSKATLPFSGIH